MVGVPPDWPNEIGLLAPPWVPNEKAVVPVEVVEPKEIPVPVEGVVPDPKLNVMTSKISKLFTARAKGVLC